MSKPETREDRFEAVMEAIDKRNDVNLVSATPNAIAYYEPDPYQSRYHAAQFRGITPNYTTRIDPRTFDRRIQELQGAGYHNTEIRSLQRQLKGIYDVAHGKEGAESYAAAYKKAVGSLVRAVGLNTFEGDSAGSLVLPEFAPTILDRPTAMQDLWARTKGYVVAGNRMVFPKARNNDRRATKRYGGLDHFWVGEEKEIGTARPGIDDFSLILKKLAVIIFVTEELIADQSYALQQYVSESVHSELDFALSDSTIRGTGVLQPTGWLNSPGTIVVSKVGSQAADSVVAQNFLDMWARRVASQENNYVWLMNQEVEAALPALTLGAGNLGGLVYMPAGGLADRPYATLMGRPIIVTEYNSKIGDKGDVMLVDYSQYITIGKGGITETVSPHVEFLKDQIAYKFTVRVDGRPMEDEPITPAYGTQTQGACIVLEDRT